MKAAMSLLPGSEDAKPIADEVECDATSSWEVSRHTIVNTEFWSTLHWGALLIVGVIWFLSILQASYVDVLF